MRPIPIRAARNQSSEGDEMSRMILVASALLWTAVAVVAVASIANGDLLTPALVSLGSPSSRCVGPGGCSTQPPRKSPTRPSRLSSRPFRPGRADRSQVVELVPTSVGGVTSGRAGRLSLNQRSLPSDGRDVEIDSIDDRLPAALRPERLADLVREGTVDAVELRDRPRTVRYARVRLRTRARFGRVGHRGSGGGGGHARLVRWCADGIRVSVRQGPSS